MDFTVSGEPIDGCAARKKKALGTWSFGDEGALSLDGERCTYSQSNRLTEYRDVCQVAATCSHLGVETRINLSLSTNGKHLSGRLVKVGDPGCRVSEWLVDGLRL